MPTQTRFADSQTWTKNGLEAHKHITTRGALTQFSFNISHLIPPVVMYMACRFWKRIEDGTETEIGTAGTYKAEAHGTPVDGVYDVYYGSYTYPDVALLPTDCLVVRVYCRLTNNSFVAEDLACTIITEQLVAQSLDTATITVMYSITFDSGAFLEKCYFGWYSLYGEEFDRFEISNWKWTAYVPPSVAHTIMDGFTLTRG
jgi:hypothetical protein